MTKYGQRDTLGDIEVVKKSSTTLPQTGQKDLFTVVGGSIVIERLYAVVTVVIQNQANATKFIFDPTTGSDVDLCTATSIANAAVSTILAQPGALGSALAVGLAVAGQSTPQVVGTGTIDLHCAASNTGEVEVYLAYRRLDPRARVVAA